VFDLYAWEGHRTEYQIIATCHVVETIKLCCQQHFAMLPMTLFELGDRMTARERPYTLQFAMEVTALSSQAMRHWRGVLPPLKGRSAHHPCFSAGDLLALKVLQAWVEGTGGRIGRIGRLEDSAAELFTLCVEESWSRIEQSFLAHDLETGRWELVADRTMLRWPNGAVLLPIGLLARELSAQLFGSRGPGLQTPLEFPLMGVSGNAPFKRSATTKGRA
jgi:hypothetical protein